MGPGGGREGHVVAEEGGGLGVEVSQGMIAGEGK